MEKLYILAAILIIGFFAIGNYFYNFSLNARKDKSEVFKNNQAGDFVGEKPEDIKWFLENKEEISMKSTTGLDLVAYRFKNDSNLWAIVIHGYTGKGQDMGFFAKKFYDMGFNVLVPDLLGHGQSGGNTITMGGLDSNDIIKWTDKISIEEVDPKILLFGISMGAATVLNTIGKNPPKNVLAFIEDSGYINVEEIFSHQLKKMFKVPKFLVMPPANLVTRIRGGYFLNRVDASNSIKNAKIPGLILHGDMDDFVPVDNAYRLYEMLNNEKEIHISKGAIHVQGALIDKDYWKVVENFVNKYIK